MNYLLMIIPTGSLGFPQKWRKLPNYEVNINSKIKEQSAYTLPTELLDKPTNIEGFFSGNSITEEPLLKAKQE